MDNNNSEDIMFKLPKTHKTEKIANPKTEKIAKPKIEKLAKPKTEKPSTRKQAQDTTNETPKNKQRIQSLCICVKF